MELRQLLVASTLVISVFVPDAHASSLWTVSMRGTIIFGYDATGVFGSAGRDLTGLNYTQTITASVDPDDYTNVSGSLALGYDRQLWGYDGAAFMNIVAVDGVLLTFYVPRSTYSYQAISNGVSFDFYSGYPDQISSYQIGLDNSGRGEVSAINQMFTRSAAGAFVPTVDFNQTLSALASHHVNAFSHFALTGNGSARFDGAAHSIIVNGETETVDVPEPATVVLVCVGLVGVGISRRRIVSRKQESRGLGLGCSG